MTFWVHFSACQFFLGRALRYFRCIILQLAITRKAKPWLFSERNFCFILSILFFINLSNEVIESDLDSLQTFLVVSVFDFSLQEESAFFNSCLQAVENHNHIVICGDFCLHFPQARLHLHLEFVYLGRKDFPVLLGFIWFDYNSLDLANIGIDSEGKILKLTPQLSQLSLEHNYIFLILATFILQGMN